MAEQTLPKRKAPLEGPMPTQANPLADEMVVPRRRKKRWTWLRYHWPLLMAHAVLLVFGLVNLYPFFWMMGTSFKAQAESNSQLYRPWPQQKYKLPAGFELDEVIPLALQPGLTEADGGDATDLRNRLREKLTLVESLQRNALAHNVRTILAGVAKQSHLPIVHEALAKASAELGNDENGDEIASGFAAMNLIEERDGTYWLTPAGREALAGELPAPDRVLLETLDSATGQAALDAMTGEVLVERLVDAGHLIATDGSLWLSEAMFDRAGRAKLPRPVRALVEGVLEIQTVSPANYARLTNLSVKVSEEEAARRLAELEAVGVLRQVGPAGDGPVLTLQPTARGVIHKGMLPRQVLTLWSMRAENVRRAENRHTYATDRWSVDDYDKKYNLASLEKASRELEQLRAEGHLTGGTLQGMNYWIVLKENNFLLHFATSLLITSVVVMGTIVISSMLGYALARMKFAGKFVVLGAIIAASVLPTEARIIPIFKMLLGLQMIENLWGMVLWLTSFGVGNALLMAGFFLTLPAEVDEAAEVDGAGTFRKFFDVALPMARPIVITVGIFAFLNAWNNFLVPLLCTISRPSMQPLAVAVYNFQQGHPGKWHEINAAAAIMIIPVIVMFLFVQKHVVRGIAVGAVKG